MKTDNTKKRYLKIACSSRGADMGRSNHIPDDMNTCGKLRLEKLKWYDGDYDSGGCYWGSGRGQNIYWAYGETATEQVDIFVRTVGRKDAKEQIMSLHKLSSTNFHR